MGNFRRLPISGGEKRDVAYIVNNIMDGKINSTGVVTLDVNSATSIISDLRVGPDSVILFAPTTSNAALELASGGMFTSSQGKQTFTITHANNAQADRTFKYAVLG